MAAGDTITFGNGVDVYQDFAAGATGDTLACRHRSRRRGLQPYRLWRANALGGGAADDLVFLSGGISMQATRRVH